MAQFFQECNPTYITTSTTTHIAVVGINVLVHTVVVPKTTTGSITFRDLTASPVTYFVLPAATVAGTYTFDARCGNGLDVVTFAADVVIVNAVVL